MRDPAARYPPHISVAPSLVGARLPVGSEARNQGPILAMSGRSAAPVSIVRGSHLTFASTWELGILPQEHRRSHRRHRPESAAANHAEWRRWLLSSELYGPLCGFHWSTRAGTPTAVAPGGTSWVTTALAPIFAPAPTRTGPIRQAPTPIVTSGPMLGVPLPVPARVTR